MYDMPQPLTSCWRSKKDWAMRNMTAKAASVVTRVYGEKAQGLRSRWRHVVVCPSAALCGIMSLARAGMARGGFW